MKRKEDWNKDTTSDAVLIDRYIFGKQYTKLDWIRFWISKWIIPKSASTFYNLLELKLNSELVKMSCRERDKISSLHIDIIIRD